MLGGAQVPVMPLLDVLGKTAGITPWQYGPKFENVGLISAPALIT